MTRPKKPSHSSPLSNPTFESRAPWLGTAGSDLLALLELSPQAGAAFWESITLRLQGPLSRERLRVSFLQTMERHPALRICLTQDGECVEIPLAQLEPMLFLETQDSEGIDSSLGSLSFPKRPGHRTNPVPFVPLIQARLVRRQAEEHLLILTSHHLVCDRSGLFAFLQEWSECFAQVGLIPADDAERAEKPSVRAGVVSDRDLSKWSARFSDGFPVLELPFDHPRSLEFAYRGARYLMRLDQSQLQPLLEVIERLGLDLRIVLLGLFQQLLHRLTGQESLVIGVDLGIRHSEQNRVGTRHALLVRSGEGAGSRGSEYLRAVALEVQEAAELPQVGFSSLLRALKVPSNSSRPPVFAAAFSFEEQWNTPLFLGLAVCQESLCDRHPSDTARVDLELGIRHLADGALWLDWSVNAQALDLSTVERWAGHFAVLLEAFAQNPEAEPLHLPLLTESQRRLLVEDWNATRRPFPSERRLHEWFEIQTEKTPGSVALVTEHAVLSYRELNERADALARILRERGLVREQRVGIFVNRNEFSIIGMLGVLKAGGAYVPLDPDYPRDRIAFILSDAQVAWVLTEQALTVSVPPHSGGIVVLDDPGLLDTIPGDAGTVLGAASDLAYIIYTSGSTGRPKGVMLEHRNAVAFVAWAQEVFSSAELSGVLCSTSFCFDLSIFEIYVPLCSGGTVILSETSLRIPPLPEGRVVTLMNTSPSIIDQALRERAIPKTVSVINLGAELVRTEVVDRLYEFTEVRKVFDLYGPTEDTTYSTYTLREPGRPASIGRPIANTQVYLLDRFLQPVPVGVAGELHLGGAGLARGYWGHPEMTSERFIPNPFSPGARIYRTGDLARYRPGGEIEYLGRIDRQLKVNGIRIEPAEIESELLRLEGVQEAAVLARGEGEGGRRLIAYLVPRPGFVIEAQALRSELRRSLPLHLVPAEVILLSRLPRTPSGKLDHAALPVPPSETKSVESSLRSRVAPTTKTEAVLVAIWREVLNLAEVGVEEDFFSLGGHSLVAIQLSRRVQQQLGIRLTLRAVFDTPTIQALAALLDRRLADEAE